MAKKEAPSPDDLVEIVLTILCSDERIERTREYVEKTLADVLSERIRLVKSAEREPEYDGQFPPSFAAVSLLSAKLLRSFGLDSQSDHDSLQFELGMLICEAHVDWDAVARRLLTKLSIEFVPGESE